jgi:ABC-type transport system involved in multi-copper enzyme maturation permease subunit
MTWLTWRQFRTQTWITVGGLAVLGVLLAITARSIVHAYDAANVAGCGSNCTNAIDSFLQDVRSGTSGTVYDLAVYTMYLVPALIGIFWGAPLIAREVESGTHRLAWNQSVTRTRWLVIKLGIIGGASVATVGVLSWAITSWAHRIDEANGDRIKPLIYGARGVVPISYALFAFVLGVTAGMLIRRTVPAMAATLAVYIGAVAAMPLWIRGHLTSVVHATPALDLANLRGIGLTTNGTLRVFAEAPANAWVLSNHVVTSTGQAITGNAQYCSPSSSPEACRQWLGTLGLRQDLTYHPASHFWSLQWAETSIFVGLAVLLTGFCFWWIRRRVG